MERREERGKESFEIFSQGCAQFSTIYPHNFLPKNGMIEREVLTYLSKEFFHVLFFKFSHLLQKNSGARKRISSTIFISFLLSSTKIYGDIS